MISAEIKVKKGSFDFKQITDLEKFAPRILADAILEKASEILIANGSVASGKTLQSGIVLQTGPKEWTVKFGGGAVYLEFGTEPHEIRPLNKKALAFPRAGGRGVIRGGQRKTQFNFQGRVKITGLVFAKVVHHPGTDPKPFFRPAIDYVISHQKEILKNALPNYKGGIV